MYISLPIDLFVANFSGEGEEGVDYERQRLMYCLYIILIIVIYNIPTVKESESPPCRMRLTT